MFVFWNQIHVQALELHVCILGGWVPDWHDHQVATVTCNGTPVTTWSPWQQGRELPINHITWLHHEEYLNIHRKFKTPKWHSNNTIVAAMTLTLAPPNGGTRTDDNTTCDKLEQHEVAWIHLLSVRYLSTHHFRKQQLNYLFESNVGLKRAWNRSMSYEISSHEISRSLEIERSGVKMVISLWNFADASAAVLPKCLTNLKAITKF